ncbi:MAG TPA: MarC family protein [Paracoccus sp. (in: a-proteobacteria)]|uniref:MarC family protein n=1 Tax=uncultured Paracoccus sp. TaxID=189685 RepID=UPI00262B008F|nr:MarC family protein [uncultured Paracoccus sp.]HMQ39904.1 MarC family protein [Paracoccus sp. (in: a-proteobacteria)]HMR35585.1 MarC family protein [Paracoccus sp. (in: a-proteobacteria)]
MDLNTIFREFITLFVVIDPIGSIPVFLFATKYVPRALHRRFAIRAVAVATAVLLGFLFFGQLVLEAMGLRLGSFQIAGGIVLFIFAMTMIFGDSKPQREIEEAERDHLEGAVFPLAIPSIASPGAMLGVVVLTDNHQNSFGDQLITAGALLVVLAITLALLLAATRVYKYIGNTGANIISRVMGMLLAAVAVDAILGGMDVMGLANVVGGAGEMLAPN